MVLRASREIRAVVTPHVLEGTSGQKCYSININNKVKPALKIIREMQLSYCRNPDRPNFHPPLRRPPPRPEARQAREPRKPIFAGLHASSPLDGPTARYGSREVGISSAITANATMILRLSRLTRRYLFVTPGG